MTPEEIAKQIADDREAYTELYAGGEYGVDEAALTRIIAQAIRDAYERAAQVAEESIDDALVVSSIVADIRALKGEG